ncbi:MAG: hypothetical protein IPI02_12120 [Sterolibacteriaceae bacterium]|nr:hypothetical protein [Sterolibacteriaceae bacterium]
MIHDDNDSVKEPEWVNPGNDRRTPFTEEELDVFVEGFISGLDDHEWSDMKSKLGEVNARARIRAGLIKADDNNLFNILPDGLVH